MDITKVDFNLIKPFMAVYKSGSMTEAAVSLGTQRSWVSKRIRDLREITGDPLFVSSGRSVVPTARAEEIAKNFSQVYRSIEKAINIVGSDFDFTNSTKTFSIAVDDYSDQVIIPSFQTFLEERLVGSGIKVSTTAINTSTDGWQVELAKLLNIGDIDLAIVHENIGGVNVNSQRLLIDDWVLFGNRYDFTDEEELQEVKLSAWEIRDLPAAMPQHSPLIELLSKKKADSIYSICPFFQTVALRVHEGRGQKRIGHLPRKLAQFYFESSDFNFIEIKDPYRIEKIETNLCWGEVLQGDSAIQWIRKMLSDHCEVI